LEFRAGSGLPSYSTHSVCRRFGDPPSIGTSDQERKSATERRLLFVAHEYFVSDQIALFRWDFGAVWRTSTHCERWHPRGWRHITTSAATSWKVFRTAQVLPVVDVKRIDTHPWSVTVRLAPNALKNTRLSYVDFRCLGPFISEARLRIHFGGSPRFKRKAGSKNGLFGGG
jgi:hypothetical protein